MEEQSLSLQGKVFDVLGEAFADNTPLQELLVKAIRYGNDRKSAMPRRSRGRHGR